jgi:hypothetical protein
MPRRNLDQIVGDARGVLTEGEQVVEYGPCWAAPLRPRVPLLLLGRRQLLMVLTDRRVLLFARWRSGLRTRDLVIGKRYESFTMLRCRRHRPLLQLLVNMPPRNRIVFEFRPRRRRVGEALAHRLDPSLPAPAPPAAPAPTPAAAPAPAPEAAPPGAGKPPDRGDDAVFWGTPNQTS